MPRARQRPTFADTAHVPFDPGPGLRAFADVLDPDNPAAVARREQAAAAAVLSRTYPLSRSCPARYPGCDATRCATHPDPADAAAAPDVSADVLRWAAGHLDRLDVLVALAARTDLPVDVADRLYNTPAPRRPRPRWELHRHPAPAMTAERVAALVASPAADPTRLRRLLTADGLDGIGAALLLDKLGPDAAYTLLVAHPRNGDILDAVDVFGDWDARVAVAVCRHTTKVPGSVSKLRRCVSDVAARCGRDPSIPYVLARLADGWNASIPELVTATKLLLAIGAPSPR